MVRLRVDGGVPGVGTVVETCRAEVETMQVHMYIPR
jgi:hypothetical protein